MTKIDPIEKHLFFSGILMKYGYDFRQYAAASLDRRLAELMLRHESASLLELLKFALQSSENFRKILPFLTISTTEFFRDPVFFKELVDRVFAQLRTYPKISIWIAGCSTGEEALSLAILLQEENLYERATIYATDVNPVVLSRAKEGIYESDLIAEFNKKYVAAGGRANPSSYYSSEYGLVRFDRKLLKNISFLEHNLATDDVFVEAHLILCRNVLIYFNKELQDRVLRLFARSLAYKAYLGLGPKESIRFLDSERYFEPLPATKNLFQQRVKFLQGEPL